MKQLKGTQTEPVAADVGMDVMEKCPGDGLRRFGRSCVQVLSAILINYTLHANQNIQLKKSCGKL